MNSWTVAALAGALVVVVLAVYAVVLALRLRRYNRQLKARLIEAREQQRAAERVHREDIAIICNALLQGEMSDTEAAMRVAHLGRRITPTDSDRQYLKAFDDLAEATAHIPILDDWKALDKADKKRYNRERASHEEKYRKAIRDNARRWAKGTSPA